MVFTALVKASCDPSNKTLVVIVKVYMLVWGSAVVNENRKVEKGVGGWVERGRGGGGVKEMQSIARKRMRSTYIYLPKHPNSICRMSGVRHRLLISGLSLICARERASVMEDQELPWG